MPRVTKMSGRQKLAWAAVLLFALVSRLGALWIAHARNPDCILTPDSHDYLGPARALLELHRYSVSPEQADVPELVRPPGYAAFLAAVFRASGESPLAAVTAQILLSLLTIGLVFWIARRIWGVAAGLLAAALMVFDPGAFLYSQQIMTECVFTFLLTLALAIGVALLTASDKRSGLAAAFGCAIAAAALVRPTAYYWIGPVWLGIAVFGVLARWNRNTLGAVLGLTLLPWLLLCGGWQLRNREIAGRAFFSLMSRELFRCKGTDIQSYLDNTSKDAASAKLRAELPPMEDWPIPRQYAYLESKAWRMIRAHPFLFLRSVGHSYAQDVSVPGETELLQYLSVPILPTGCLGDLLRLSPREYVQRWILGHPGLFLIFLFAGGYLGTLYAGSLLALRSIPASDRAGFFVHGLLLGTALFLSALSGLSDGVPRYRSPIMPILCVYAGAGWSAALRKKKAG